MTLFGKWRSKNKSKNEQRQNTCALHGDKTVNEDMIWQAYPQKASEIARYLAQDEGVKVFFNSPSKEEIVAKLNEPSLKVFCGGGVLTYCNHEFDDIHIIDLEFEGLLDKFASVSIDG